MNIKPIIKEVVVRASGSKVWQTITDIDKMKDWYFDMPVFKTEIGFTFKLYGEKEDKKYPISCRIIELEMGKKIAYTWNYDDFPMETVVCFEIIEMGTLSKLKFSHSGLEKIPSKYKEVSRDVHELGWEAIIGDSFKYYVEKD
jgi:uncharacterized protein YndB with AHSA1/START domain